MPKKERKLMKQKQLTEQLIHGHFVFAYLDALIYTTCMDLLQTCVNKSIYCHMNDMTVLLINRFLTMMKCIEHADAPVSTTENKITCLWPRYPKHLAEMENNGIYMKSRSNQHDTFSPDKTPITRRKYGNCRRDHSC